MSRLGTVWNPWHEVNRLRREMDRVFGQDFNGQTGQTSRFPAINVMESESGLELRSELPGIDPSQLDISLEKDSLTIRGKREDAPLTGDQNYVRRERWFGEFERTVELPFDVDPDKCEANYEKGVLTITLHRAPELQPKKLQVKAG